MIITKWATNRVWKCTTWCGWCGWNIMAVPRSNNKPQMKTHAIHGRNLFPTSRTRCDSTVFIQIGFCFRSVSLTILSAHSRLWPFRTHAPSIKSINKSNYFQIHENISQTIIALLIRVLFHRCKRCKMFRISHSGATLHETIKSFAMWFRCLSAILLPIRDRRGPATTATDTHIHTGKTSAGGTPAANRINEFDDTQYTRFEANPMSGAQIINK